MNSHDQALYELMSERYDGLQANYGTLRASLGRVERRNEELNLALEVARRELEVARETRNRAEARGEAAVTVMWLAEKERDAARGEMAGLRDRVEELEKFAEKQPLSYLTPRDGTVILGWSKEWALGSMLMRVNSHGVWVNLHGDAFPDAPTHWAPRVHWHGWINGGPR